MRSKSKRPPTLAELGAWKRWFAWRPVKASTGYGCTYQWVWLEMVERKIEHPQYPYSSDYLYRLSGAGGVNEC